MAAEDLLISTIDNKTLTLSASHLIFARVDVKNEFETK